MRVMSEVERYIRQAAINRGIDPDIAVEVAKREGGLSNPTQQSRSRKNGIREPSYGPFQMLVGGPGTGFPRGIGNSFVAQTGMHPSNPEAWKEGVDFALDNAKSRGWGAWYGAKAAGITGFKGIGRSPSTAFMQDINAPIPQERPSAAPAETATQAIYSILSPEAQPATVNERMGLLNANAYSPPQEEPQMANNTLPTRSVKTISYFQPEPQVSLDTLRQPQMGLLSLADQYASYGAGKQPTELAGLLSQDVAHQRMIDQLNAQKQQLQAGVNPMGAVDPWKAQPQVQVQAQPPEVAQVEPPEMVTQPISQPQGYSGGLLSPQEQEQFAAQHAFLSQQPDNSQLGQKAGRFAKGAIGGIGGGLLGAALLGPIGGLLGAALGKSAMTGRLNEKITGFPKAPDRAGSTGNTGRISKSQLNDRGRDAYNSSEQFRDAVDRGSVGLY